jgi:hypothetical protein
LLYYTVFNYLCIVLLAAGPWIGPFWPQVSFVQDAHPEAKISACGTGEIHDIGSPITPDVRIGGDVSATVTDCIVDPPSMFPGRDLQRSALPQPTRIFLITSHASSYL